TLQASSGSWSGSPGSFGYQWRRCDSSGAGCADVAGATAQSYQVAAADVGATLRVRVTATNAGGSASADSAQTGIVAGAPTGFFDSFVTDAGCAGCSAVEQGGVLTARIAGGADAVDTAYGLKDLGAGGLPGRVYTRTVLTLPAGQALGANLVVLAVAD